MFLLIVALLASPLPDAEPPSALPRGQSADRSGEAFTGTLSTADPLSLVVRADNGALVRFAVDEPFVVPAGLVPGTRITVRYEDPGDGSRRALRVGAASLSGDLGATTEPPVDVSGTAAEAIAQVSAPESAPPLEAPGVGKGVMAPSAESAPNRPTARLASAASVPLAASPMAGTRPIAEAPSAVGQPPPSFSLLSLAGLVALLAVASGLLVLAVAKHRP